jgi:hypothetical protein
MLNAVVEWIGLDSENDLNYAMPNRVRAGARLYRADEIFESAVCSANEKCFGLQSSQSPKLWSLGVFVLPLAVAIVMS